MARSAEHDANATVPTLDDIARISFLFRDDKQFELVRNAVLRSDVKREAASGDIHLEILALKGWN